MSQKNRQLILPLPTFSDEEVHIKARIVTIILLAIMVGAMLSAMIAWGFGDHETSVILLAGLPAVFLALWFMWRGNLQIAGMMALLTLLGATFSMQFVDGGAHDLSITFYPIILIVASIVLNYLAFVTLVILTILTYGIVVYLELFGKLKTIYEGQTDGSTFIFMAIILLLTAVAMRLLTNHLWQYLHQARQNEEALRQSNLLLTRQQDELKRYTYQLERSNRELQEFAYVSSHDLQEPLRKIQTFGDRLATKYADVLDERGQDYLVRMQDAAARMQKLILDLLTFSRVQTHSEPFGPVDLDKVVKRVLIELAAMITAVDAQIIVSDLPTIEADGTQMFQLFEHLIHNALKYHMPDRPCIISISAELLAESSANDNGQMCYIMVKDNGIGFEPQYAERIFGIFQRLHGRSDYEGTGVGLAVCRRIVERHHGHIQTTGQLAEGATFTIALPIKQPASQLEIPDP